MDDSTNQMKGTFQFKMMWYMHKDFAQMVKENQQQPLIPFYKAMYDLVFKLKRSKCSEKLEYRCFW